MSYRLHCKNFLTRWSVRRKKEKKMRNCLYCVYSVVDGIDAELVCSKTKEVLTQETFLEWPKAKKCCFFEEEEQTYGS